MNRSICIRASFALAVALALAACSSPPKTLYAWDGYNDAVYSYLKNEASPEEQVLAFEKGIQTANAKGLTVPPGYYAHLGLVYLKTGRTEQAINAWEHEKSLFPESQTYIDFLLRNMQKNKG